MRFLPGYIANVAPQVDGIVALDNRSTDGSAEFLESRDEVLAVLRVPPAEPVWNELPNYRRLVRAAVRLGGEWLLSLDADERVERDFRIRAERVISRGRVLGHSAYAVRFRELWESGDAYRADGIWGRKTKGILFGARADHHFDPRPVHGVKYPLQARANGACPEADLEVYHLRMVRPEDRVARRRRYEELDPHASFQPGIGYDYLTDERGLRLERVPAGRMYTE
jgi:hypothetical protein